ncbi:MAG TPA: hypothetical protein VGB89_08855 [Bacteroidota bacterium]
MGDYFKYLNTMDPLFHALVLSRIKDVEDREGMKGLTIDDLVEEDELEILRKYTLSLYKEYKTLRTIFLENMQLSSRSVRIKSSSN